MKSTDSRLIVKVETWALGAALFSGTVIVPWGNNTIGLYSMRWITDGFEPYTPTPQELAEWGETDTLTNDNPNKVEVDDKNINLRLECLKLAIEHTETNVIGSAELFYEWITEKP